MVPKKVASLDSVAILCLHLGDISEVVARN